MDFIQLLNDNAELFARLQFTFTISFHIIFPAISIGLAAFLTVIELLYLKTRETVYKDIYQLWVRVFAVCFGLGVVSGIVMAYQFGTNWGLFADKVGNVIGPLLGLEVLTAFFLEASFLGIMLFGWGRVSERMHFTATAMVSFGTILSAFWILSANSWMQTPQGFIIGDDGLFYPTNWIDVIFNPSFPYRFLHMLLAAFLSTSFFVGGISAIYLLRKKAVDKAKITFFMAMVMAIFITPIQLFVGDLHGLNTREHQPIKVAAMEGIWDNETGAGLRLFALPSQEQERNLIEIKIPKLASLILGHSTDATITGLKSVPKEQRPPVAIVFWSFRIMVLIGLLMLFIGVVAAILYFKKQLYSHKWFLRLNQLMTPSGVIAIIAGWVVTEVGRQPYTVYELLHRSDSLSPVIGSQVALSLLLFIIVYTFIFGAGMYYIYHILKKATGTENTYLDRAKRKSMLTKLSQQRYG